MPEGEGEGDPHKGEDEAEEKEPNVQFLLSPSSQTETISCIYFTCVAGRLYSNVLRGEFLLVISNCLTLMYSVSSSARRSSKVRLSKVRLLKTKLLKAQLLKA